MARRNLDNAKVAKKDEFYTQMADIERELQHYWPHFRDKVVLCNCDDPYESNFFKYFALNFNQLGLKKLICTCFDGSPVLGNELLLDFGDFTDDPKKMAYKVEITEVKDLNGDGAVDLADVQYLLKNDKNAISLLKQHGDFRSAECIELLKEADIVVTNPPFSLFREYIGQLITHEKKFVIVGHQNAITYKEIFPLIKENKVWLGYGFKGGAAHFFSPYEDIATASDHRKDMIRVSGVNWFTNLDHNKRHEEMDLVRLYSPEDYPKYDNYDAINVDKTQDIPCDYPGAMGVPITFLDKYNPEQFEIIKFRKGNDDKDLSVKGKCPYFRILIRNKHPQTL
ncbi:MAG: adenine-specific methyltransferase EcoRI family protein [Bacteroidaceae bacterium]|nr:adenine-specific methyltransferase EcoRI family protein [Bacteroidaceae bacterium]